MELSTEEFHKRISKAQAIQDKEDAILDAQAKTPKKYIYDSKASLTAEQTVAVALGYSKDEYGAYQYPTNDEIERSYEFQTALRAEIVSHPTGSQALPGSHPNRGLRISRTQSHRPRQRPQSLDDG